MRRLRWVVLFGLGMVSFGWAQKAERGPQLLILMLGVPTPEKAEVAYSVNAAQFYSYTLPHTRKDCQLIMDVDGREHCQQGQIMDFELEASVNRVPGDRVRAVMFIPGCQPQLLDVAIQGKIGTRLDAKCIRVPIWKFKGWISDDSLKDTKWLKVQVMYQANWAPQVSGRGEDRGGSAAA